MMGVCKVMYSRDVKSQLASLIDDLLSHFARFS